MCVGSLGMTEEQYNDDFFDVLGHLGLDSSQINAANDYVLGRRDNRRRAWIKR